MDQLCSGKCLLRDLKSDPLAHVQQTYVGVAGLLAKYYLYRLSSHRKVVNSNRRMMKTPDMTVVLVLMIPYTCATASDDASKGSHLTSSSHSCSPMTVSIIIGS